MIVNFKKALFALMLLISMVNSAKAQLILTDVNLIGGVFPAQNLGSYGEIGFGINFNNIAAPTQELHAEELYITIALPVQISMGSTLNATVLTSSGWVPTNVWDFVLDVEPNAAYIMLNSTILSGAPDGMYYFKIPFTVSGPIAAPTNGDTKNYIIDAALNGNGRPLGFTSSSITQRSSIITATTVSLPVTFNHFTATVNACKAELEWNVAKEMGTEYYAVERSADGRSFDKIGGFAFNNNAKGDYRFVDEKPLQGNNLYRIAATDPDGTVVYSEVKRIAMDCEVSNIAMFPNPTSSGVKISGLKAGQRITLYDLTGRMLVNTKATGEEAQLDLSNYAAAMYKVIVTSAEGIVIYNNKLAKQ